MFTLFTLNCMFTLFTLNCMFTLFTLNYVYFKLYLYFVYFKLCFFKLYVYSVYFKQYVYVEWSPPVSLKNDARATLGVVKKKLLKNLLYKLNLTCYFTQGITKQDIQFYKQKTMQYGNHRTVEWHLPFVLCSFSINYCYKNI